MTTRRTDPPPHDPADHTAEAFLGALRAEATPEQQVAYERYFPPGRRPAGATPDHFVGVPMGRVFALAKTHHGMPLDELERLLENDVHEARAGALRIMANRAGAKGATDDEITALAELYLRRHDRVDDWDLVDLAAWHVVGRYVLPPERRGLLDDLARSPDPWRRRTAVLAPLHLVLAHAELDDAYRLAERLLADPHPLVQKPIGWVLRTAGGVDLDRLHRFLRVHAPRMSAPALSAAVEKLPPAERRHYRELRKAGPTSRRSARPAEVTDG